MEEETVQAPWETDAVDPSVNPWDADAQVTPPTPEEQIQQNGTALLDSLPEQDKTVVGLPIPAPDMFTNLESQEEKDVLYNAYKNHPNTQHLDDGTLIYKGQIVPADEITLRNKVQGSTLEALESMDDPFMVPKAAVKGLSNAGHEINKTALALGDTALRTAGVDTNMAGQYNDTFQKFDKTGIAVPDFLMETFEALPGTLVGTKGGDKLIRATSGLFNRAARRVTGFLGGTIGGSATMDPETETIIVGNKYNIPGLRGFAIDPNGDFSEELLKKKMNLIQDSLIMGGSIAGAGAALGGTMRYVINLVPRSIKNWRSLDAHQRQFVNDILEVFADVSPTDSREVINEKMAHAASIVGDNAKLLATFGDADVGDIQMAQDAISAMLDRLDMNNPNHRRMAEELNSLRSSVMQGGSPRLQDALKQPKAEMERVFTEFETSRGGSKAIEGAKDKMVTVGQQNVAPARERIRDTRGELVRAERGIDDTIQTDPAFKEITDKSPKVGGQVDTDITGPEVRTLDEVTGNIEQADRLLTKKKNDLYDAIPDSAKVNPNALADAYEAAGDNLPEALRAEFGQAGDNFKKLNTLANTKLQDEITRLRKAGSFTQADALRDLKKAITDDQLDYLVTSGDTATRDAAQKATEFFKKDYAPKFRDSPLQEVQENSRFKRPTTARVDSRKIVKDTISNPEAPEFTQQVIDTLMTKEGGGSAQKAVDYALYNLSRRVRQSVNNSNGKITPELAQELTGDLDKFVPLLDKAAPGKRKELENFLTSIRNQNFNAKEVKQKLIEFEKKGKEIEEEWLGDRLGDFFRKTSDGYQAKSNGFEIFKKILSNPDSDNKLQEIIKLANGDEVATKGLQAAWAKTVREDIFSGKELPSKLDENFIRYGKEIFADNPAAIDGIEKIFAASKKLEGATTARQGVGLGFADSQVAFNRGVNAMITWIWGILNPAAARIRTVTSDFAKTRDSKDIAKLAADTVLADAEVFAKIAKDVTARKTNHLTDQEKRILFNSMVRAGIYDSDDEEGVLGKMANIENTVRSTASKIKEQTNKALAR